MSTTSGGRRIAVVGGTGDLGKGLAARLSRSHEVYIGSRDVARAEAAAAEVKALSGGNVVGLSNEDATKRCDVAILAIPNLPTTEMLSSLSENLKGKLVISPIVPMEFNAGIFTYAAPTSAAEQVAAALQSRVVSAFHTVPAEKLVKVDEAIDYDVPVAAETRELFTEAAALISSIAGLRPIYVGPLRNSRLIESITPLLLNIARFGRIKSPSIKIV